MSTQYQHPAQNPEQQTRGVSVPHLVVGLVFLGIAGSWLLHEVGVIESVQVQWLLPLILVVAGGAGLLAALTRGFTRGSAARPPEPAPVHDEEPFLTHDDEDTETRDNPRP